MRGVIHPTKSNTDASEDAQLIRSLFLDGKEALGFSRCLQEKAELAAVEYFCSLLRSVQFKSELRVSRLQMFYRFRTGFRAEIALAPKGSAFWFVRHCDKRRGAEGDGLTHRLAALQ